MEVTVAILSGQVPSISSHDSQILLPMYDRTGADPSFVRRIVASSILA